MSKLLIVFASLLPFSVGSAAAGPFSFFTWTESGAGFVASQSGVNATVTYSTAGDDPLFRRDLTMTDPLFVSKYGDFVPTLKIDNGAAGSAGSGDAALLFSPPLPAGSRLFIFDVDVQQRGERMILSRRATPQLVEQLETQAGAASAFPSWTPGTGLLAATATTPNNEEATVFDASGVGSIEILFRRDVGGDGFNGASFAFAIPVPEPASCAMLAAGIAFMARLVAARRRAS